MKVTIKDIAKRVGVSHVTVSNALRDSGRMTEGTRQHIMEVAHELGYRPNTYAKATRTGLFNAAGLLMSTRHDRSHMSLGLLDGIQGELSENEMHLVVARLPDEKLTDEVKLPRILREWMTDGLLINYNNDVPEEMTRLIHEHALPSIWINADMESDCICPDDKSAGQLATEHLLSHGHRNIAYMRLPLPIVRSHEHHSVYRRYEGYQQAIYEAGLTPREMIGVPATRAGDAGMKDTRIDEIVQWLRRDDRPSAVVTYSSYSAQPLLYGATLLGIRVPEELAIITIEDRPVTSQGIAITTVGLNVEEIGRQAVRMLLRKIQSPKKPLTAELVPVKLIHGQTC